MGQRGGAAIGSKKCSQSGRFIKHHSLTTVLEFVTIVVSEEVEVQVQKKDPRLSTI